MKKICVITATRAEYGLLYPLLRLLEKDEELELQLIVSGTHLSKEFGYTKTEIVRDGFMIAEEIDILELESDACAVSRSMGKAIIQFAEYLRNNRPDIAVILGDRYEMMAFAVALVNEKIPIAHLNGGETTEGALDEVYRHCITKMSSFHFVNCETHRKRVIQMGENPDRVFNVGDTCVDNIMCEQLMTKQQLMTKLDLSEFPKNLVIVTYHPVTLEGDSLEQLKCLLRVLERHSELFYVFTKANADCGGIELNHYMQEILEKWENAILVDSLGRKAFLSVLSYSQMMIGNSSSGIYEAPVFHIPTINIGNRQKGRLHGDTVIDCPVEEQAIDASIKLAMSAEFRRRCRESENIFGDGHASEKILKVVKEVLKKKIDLQKKFYDM